jgi:hypothetical protein
MTMTSTTTCTVAASDTVCVTEGSNFPLDRSETLLVIAVFLFVIGYQFFDRILTVNTKKYDV